MQTKFNIGDEVFIKARVTGIEVSTKGTIYYNAVYLNQEGMHSPIGVYTEDNVYECRSDVL